MRSDLLRREWEHVFYNHGGLAEFTLTTNMVHLHELVSIGGEFTLINKLPGPNFTQTKLE